MALYQAFPDSTGRRPGCFSLLALVGLVALIAYLAWRLFT